MQVPNEMATQYQDVLSAQDVAVYGGLCALASFDRSELRSHVINNVSFRDYMEINPQVVLDTFCYLLYMVAAALGCLGFHQPAEGGRVGVSQSLPRC